MSHVLELASLHVDSLPEGTNLVDELKAFQSQGVSVPCMWTLAAGPDDLKHRDRVVLDFGVSSEADKGALLFGEFDVMYVPADGTNEDEVCYRMAGTHPTYFPPGAEVSLNRVYAALEEFIRTRKMPTAIGWTVSNR